MGVGALAGAAALVVGLAVMMVGGTRAAGHGVARAPVVRSAGGARWLNRRCPPPGRRRWPAGASREVLATSTGGVGTHVRSILAPAAGRRVRRSRSAGRRPPTSCSPSPRRARRSRRSGSRRGWRRPPTRAPWPTLRRALADTDLVHAHGLRAGLVAAVARRLAAALPAAGAHAAQRPSRGGRRCAAASWPRSSAPPSAAPTWCSPRPATSPTTRGGWGPATSAWRRSPRRRCRRCAARRAEVRTELGLERRAAARRRGRPPAPAEGLRGPPGRGRPLGRRRRAGPARRDRRRRAAARRAGRAGSAPSGCR